VGPDLTRAHALRLYLVRLTRRAHPELSDQAAFTVDRRDRDEVRRALRGQLVAAERTPDGDLPADAGVVDDLYKVAVFTTR